MSWKTLLHKIVGSSNDRQLKKMRPMVEAINALEPELAALSLDQLRAKTDEFRASITSATQALREQLADAQAQLEQEADPDEQGYLKEDCEKIEKELREAEAQALGDLLPQAFAVVRETSRRVTGMRHFDCQLIGGMVLHQGRIAEMKTGEGKTLVATLPLYLNALLGRGSHLVTVNDYLARRDVQWMGPIFHTLGLSVGSIVHDTSFVFDPSHVVKDYRFLNLRPVSRQEAYRADVTYGTNNEFGFDYLRDNMKFSDEDYAQREPQFAIVDEVDNILIDEARTPLIISGPAEESTEKYYALNRVIPRLQKDLDYAIDEKQRNATLTEEGVSKVERILRVKNLYDPAEIGTLHHVNQALRAHALFKRDVDYVVKDGEVVIVDEFTGRLMPGRRWSDGLHQAVEAKEGVRIRQENQTLATITIQNYFRMYHKLGGMTGTADTEAVEFKKIYSLDVVVIPPNKGLSRQDFPDVVYKTEREKFQAVADEIAECHQRGQPVLVGTVSVEKSERLSKLLKKKHIKHNVLNAVNHEAEANIIAQAGRFGGVTIATNMAGRGTDILLGGNPEFLARVEIEKTWLKKAAPAHTKTKSYEESLEELREAYNATLAKARQRYEPNWKPHEEARNAALSRLSETYRPFLHASLQHARATYQGLTAQLDFVTDAPAADVLEHYTQACETYEYALTEYDKVVGPCLAEERREEYETVCADYAGLLAEGVSGRTADRLELLRGRYERMLDEYSQAIVRMAEVALSDNGEVSQQFEQARLAHQEAQQAYDAADQLYEEKRQPYEAAVAEAERVYEEQRRERVKVVEEVREQLEKSPEVYQHAFDAAQASYQETCAEERDKVVEAGGLHILGTERHEARRIDNQLRGRAGRQGDPGSSRFYLSLEDDLLRIFGADRIQGIMDRLGMEEGEPIEHGLVTRAIENAQGRVEARNFDIRKHLLEYDDVMNKQREVIYDQRRTFLTGEDLSAEALEMIEDTAEHSLGVYLSDDLPPEEWDWKALDDTLFRQFNFRLSLSEEDKRNADPDDLRQDIHDRVLAMYREREENFTPSVLRYLEKVILLQTVDALWKDHLLSMDHLKEAVGLRGYGQKNPLQEYQKEGFALFEQLHDRMRTEVVEKLFTVQVARQEDVQKMEARQAEPRRPLSMSHGQDPQPSAPAKQVRRNEAKVGRNEPCPCGSGRKYKKCHGA